MVARSENISQTQSFLQQNLIFHSEHLVSLSIQTVTLLCLLNQKPQETLLLIRVPQPDASLNLLLSSIPPEFINATHYPQTT